MRIRNIFKHKINLPRRTNNNGYILHSLKSTKGNLSILLILSTLMIAILFISVIDIFQLYIAREHTKNASDAIALALAQNLLFFDADEILITSDEISKKNGCEIESIKLGYEEITVTTLKKIEFMFAGKIFKSNNTVYSTSSVKVIYPWDERFKNCDSFILEF
jgi:hypothetical protein